MDIEFEDGVPVSKQFGDVYFSKQGGLEETRHVFLRGNDLYEDWPRQNHIRICETGFGTGLNFLAVWQLFDEQKRAGQKLFYTSIEKYPLSANDIERSLKPFVQALGGARIKGLTKSYPMPFPGFHPRQIADDVWLVLIFDDVADALSSLHDAQDIWFLDGFSPSLNPDMWRDSLYKYMARLSHRESRFSSFTAAGLVRRGLSEAGFMVEKRPGFGRKREMITGRFEKGRPRHDDPVPPKSISILGSGLSGSATGWLLQKLGLGVTIYEKAPALHLNASSNVCGLINPKIGAARIPAFDYLNSSFALFQSVFQGDKAQEIAFDRRGILHLADTDEKAQKHQKFKALMAGSESVFEALDYEELNGILFPQAGTASPRALNQFYLNGLEVKLNAAPKPSEAELKIYCGGANAGNDYPELPLQQIRGQVSYTKTLSDGHPFLSKDHPVLSYGGYAAPMSDGRVCLGATFQHWSEEEKILSEDHARNLDQLAQRFPSLAQGLEIEEGWYGFRLASKDRLPLIGTYKDGTYLSIAHGSHGMLSSLAGVHILAYELGLIPQPFSAAVLKALSPKRFQTTI